jgi:hypothetical protein
MPIEVPPFSTAFIAYSTWKFRPSGENTEFVRSYPVPIDVYNEAWLAMMALRIDSQGFSLGREYLKLTMMGEAGA